MISRKYQNIYFKFAPFFSKLLIWDVGINFIE